MASQRFRHNPGFLNPDDLIASFVVRLSDLDILLRVIRENSGPVNQHVLVLGPRGIGKTMLVRRVALAVERDPELNRRWIPIVVAEEKYDVATAGELWLEALGHLSRCAVREAPRWRSAYERLRTERDPDRLRDGALARLTEAADSEGRRLLVVFENLNLVFSEQAEKDAGWDLRKTLLGDARIMLIATATSRFDEIDNAKQPMYDLFREVKLLPLTTDECREMWRNIAHADLPGNQIRPMEILTGGNPRLLAILAGLAAGRSFKELMDDLVGLVDDHTPYFKANVESLAPRERRVFVTLAEVWNPAGASDVAALARMEVNETSEYLRRLEGRGAVERLGEREGRKVFYQVAERLYNVYHLMRQSGSQAERVRAVVEFMIRFYGPEETLDVISCERASIPPGERAEHDEAVRYLSPLVGLSGKGLEDRPMRLAAQARSGAEAPVPTEPSAVAEHAPALHEETDPLLDRARALLREATDLYEKKLFPAALATLDRILAEYGIQPRLALAEVLAKSLLKKGAALYELGRFEEARAVNDELVRSYGQRQESVLAELVAKALYNSGVAFEKQGRMEEVIRTCSELELRFGEREELCIEVQRAKAALLKAMALGRSRGVEEELAQYDEVERQFGHREEVALASWAADAQVRKATLLANQGHSEQAADLFDQVIRRRGNRAEPEFQEHLLNAMFNQGVCLDVLGNCEAAIRVYSELLSKYAAGTAPAVQETVGKALLNKAVSLVKLRRSKDALDCYDELLGRVRDRRQSFPAELIARALLYKGMELAQLNQPAEALKSYEELLATFGSQGESSLEIWVARCLLNKSWVLGMLGRLKEEVGTCDEIVARFGSRSESMFAEMAASALVNKSRTLTAISQDADAARAAAEALLHTSRVISPETELFSKLSLRVRSLAVAGQEAVILETLGTRKVPSQFEPLVVALRLLKGEAARAPREILEVAKDIVTVVQERRTQVSRPVREGVEPGGARTP